MSDFVWRWSVGRVDKTLRLRCWWGGNPVRSLFRWLRAGCPKSWWPGSAEFRTRTGLQERCYCPTGSQTELRLSFFSVGFSCWLSRDWTPRPCHCDKIVWLLCPDGYAEEIEEYGADKLRAEYPGVELL
jgi:hypothetical protein